MSRNITSMCRCALATNTNEIAEKVTLPQTMTYIYALRTDYQIVIYPFAMPSPLLALQDLINTKPNSQISQCTSLHWRHNDHDGVSNHQPHGCLLNRLFGRRSKKTSKLRVTGLCTGISPGPMNSPHKWPVTGNAENVSIGWRHHLVPYPTTHHSERKCAHFCSEWCIVGHVSDALWDLWEWSLYVLLVYR